MLPESCGCCSDCLMVSREPGAKRAVGGKLSVLGVISRDIGIYKTQMKLASMEGIMFSNAN